MNTGRPTRNTKASHPTYADPRYRAACRRLKKTDHTCHHCGYDIDPLLRHPHPLSWSADHIIPKSQLPPDDYRHWHISNLQAMHLRCNQSRGNRSHSAHDQKTTHLNTSRDWG